MGEVTAAENSPCTTVALRYRFVYKKSGEGKRELQFKPHGVIKLEPDLVKESDETLIDEVDVSYLRSLDPKEWKKQDHYKVLGLSNLRYKANDDVIKSAYRKIVLKHHPDKRKAQGEEIRPDDDYFTCITMAYETLGSITRRRAYDSVDPEFDDSVPTPNELKQDFFEVFREYFERNSRWSERSNVPNLGGIDATRKEVEDFYSFWYEFKSWREFSYEDEEDKDKCQDRDERRFVDKMNKAERLRKKKEEMSRIRTLVDLAYNNDPRIAKFKQDDKERKLAVKRAKQSAAQARKEEEERVLKEVQQAKERAEAAERERMEAKRQERELLKRAVKKEKKLFRDTCKMNNYYANTEEENLRHLQAVDKICEMLTLTELEDLNRKLLKDGRETFVRAANDSDERTQREKQKLLESVQPKASKLEKTNSVQTEWSPENLQLLIKAVNLFPAGTNQRWEVVSNFLNHHGTFTEGASKFNAKSVLAKAKHLQNTDFSKNNLKETANLQAFNNFEKDKRTNAVVDTSEITKNMNGCANTVVNGDTKVWTASEQQLLEQALKTYPASTAERWDRIAECLPERSKKECMRRYKELVETVKAKKAAQALLSSK